MSRSTVRMPVVTAEEVPFDLIRLVAAICLLLGTTPQAVFGFGPITTVWGISDANSDNKKQAVATCPPGTIAFSGGAITKSVGGSSDDLAVVYTMPSGDPPTEWVVAAQEMTATSDNWEVVAHAYCADIPGYRKASAGSAYTSDNHKSVDVSCPSGTTVIGGGSSIIAAPSQVIKLNGNRPLGNGWRAGASEFTLTDGAWMLGVMVSCAPSMDLDLEAVSATVRAETDYYQGVDLYCASHRFAIGGGWEFVGSTTSGAGLLESHASFLFREVWEVYSGSISSGQSWGLSAFALCLSSEIFSDGFEFGSAAAWSNTGQ